MEVYCAYCYKKAVEKGRSYVCEVCKSPVLTKTTDNIFSELNKGLESIQSYLEGINDACLHNILQRDLNGVRARLKQPT